MFSKDFVQTRKGKTGGMVKKEEIRGKWMEVFPTSFENLPNMTSLMSLEF